MWKAALVILAASLIFPLLVSWAATPDPAPVPLLVGAGNTSVGVFSADSSELPEELQDLSQEQKIEALLKQLEWQRPWVDQWTTCLAGDSKCEAAAAVTGMKPCLAAGDCPAAEAWEEAMGEIGVRPAPQTMTRANIRLSLPIERPEPEKD